MRTPGSQSTSARRPSSGSRPTAGRRPTPGRRWLLVGAPVTTLVVILGVSVTGTSVVERDTGRWWAAEQGIGTDDAPSAATVAQQIEAYDSAARRWDARDATESAPAATVWRSLRVDGVARHYLLSVPHGLRHGAPLVLAFHGLGQRAVTFAAQTGLVAATRSAAEILAIPESEGLAFNDGRLGAAGPHDDAFALAIIGRLVAQGLVDPERVTVAGFSNGAGMAMQVAEEHPAAVAAVVSVDGEMIDSARAPRPTGPVEAVLVHGTADRVQPWNGRRARSLTWPSYLSVPATVRAWVRADDAGRRTVSVIAAPGRPRRVGDVELSVWAPGPTGAGVRLYAIDGMGHRWPSTSAAAVGTRHDALAPVSATTIVVDTAATASREGPRTITI